MPFFLEFFCAAIEVQEYRGSATSVCRAILDIDESI